MTATVLRRLVLWVGLLLPLTAHSDPMPAATADADRKTLGLRLIAGIETDRPEDNDAFSAEVVNRLRAAADQGSAAAQRDLGLAYHVGWGVEPTATEAVRWLRTAAAHGDRAAAANLVQVHARQWAAPACADAGLPAAWRCRRMPPRLTLEP
ncbi:MAG: hypothetical protein ACFCUO_08605 [Rhodospirillales bacterium]